MNPKLASPSSQIENDQNIFVDTSGKQISRPDLLRKMSGEIHRVQPKLPENDPAPFSQTGMKEEDKEPLLYLPKYGIAEFDPPVTFHPLQEWEGFVVSVGDDRFLARLLDITGGSSHEEEEADFPLDDVRDEDKDLLRPGAVFRWSIGYQRSRGGTKSRMSRIIFRRLPQWTDKELSEAKSEAITISNALRWE